MTPPYLSQLGAFNSPAHAECGNRGEAPLLIELKPLPEPAASGARSGE